MIKPVVVVSGKNGQLGSELQLAALAYSEFDFYFPGREELNLLDHASIKSCFNKYKPAYFVNCAAYTAVDKAEQEQETAWMVNAEAVGLIARLCNNANAGLVQLSTDYVFDGTAAEPYLSTAQTNPVNYYGYTKWMGEQMALQQCNSCLVLRTSWVYSRFGNNFVKTMLRLMHERDALNIVNDQYGCPTYASDLAGAILVMLGKWHETGRQQHGIYHYSNAGITTWYDFAVAIKEDRQLACALHPITTEQFPTPARRPRYSVMDTSLVTKQFGLHIPFWKDSLHRCLQTL